MERGNDSLQEEGGRDGEVLDNISDDERNPTVIVLRDGGNALEERNCESENGGRDGVADRGAQCEGFTEAELERRHHCHEALIEVKGYTKSREVVKWNLCIIPC